MLTAILGAFSFPEHAPIEIGCNYCCHISEGSACQRSALMRLASMRTLGMRSLLWADLSFAAASSSLAVSSMVMVFCAFTKSSGSTLVKTRWTHVSPLVRMRTIISSEGVHFRQSRPVGVPTGLDCRKWTSSPHQDRCPQTSAKR